MRRGEVWTLAGGADYAGKPRPAVILQSDSFAETGSIVVCSFTTDMVEAGLLRLDVNPTSSNGLMLPSRIMIDKLAAVPRSKLGRRIGRLQEETMQRIGAAVLTFLDLAETGSNVDV